MVEHDLYNKGALIPYQYFKDRDKDYVRKPRNQMCYQPPTLKVTICIANTTYFF